MKGRKPTPRALKILKGTRRDRINDREPIPGMPKTLRAPAHLDAEARKVWKKMAPQLRNLGLLTELDTAAFSIYCQAWGMYLAAVKVLQEKGLLQTLSNGAQRSRPEIKIARDAESTILAISREFGMTPASRSRISVPQPQGPARFYEFFGSGN